jgi:UDP-2,3-diacylglucosamine pyrophosphatase LpxH
MDTTEWYFLSDLHLSGGPGPRDIDAALPHFLDSVVGADTGRRNLVLLGDPFDLQGPVRPTRGEVAERLASMADAHAGILSVLGACVRSGLGCTWWVATTTSS